jgi:hypothetical protein
MIEVFIFPIFSIFRTKAQSVDTAGIGIMNPLSWDNLSSDIKDKLRGESISAKPDSLPESNLSPTSRMEFKRTDSQGMLHSSDSICGNFLPGHSYH